MNRNVISGSFYIGMMALVQTHFILDKAETCNVREKGIESVNNSVEHPLEVKHNYAIIEHMWIICIQYVILLVELTLLVIFRNTLSALIVG